MSLLKTIKAQLGLSGTAANNFTLDASADNGTMKLARGNADATTQDILTVNAAGKVEASQGFNGASHVLAASGSISFPSWLFGGFKVNWGTASATAGGAAITFNSAFTTACYGVYLGGNGVGSYYQTQVSAVTVNGATLTSPSGTLNCFWLAIGK